MLTNVHVVADVDDLAARRLTAGWFITGIDGQPVADVLGLAKALHAKGRGASVNLEVVTWERLGVFSRRREGAVTLKIR